jgi:hypothetical protein
MNIAPAFFSIVLGSLYSSIIIWIAKLFNNNSKRGEKGFNNYLTLVRSHVGLLSKRSFMRRRKVRNDYWIFTQTSWTPVEICDIEKDVDRIKSNEVLLRIKKQRDKYYAHFDKAYFFKANKLHYDYPITLNNLNEIINLIDIIFNRYSVAFDGSAVICEPINVLDIEVLLEMLKKSEVNKYGNRSSQ